MMFFAALAALVLLAHLAWILWILFGWVFTRHRPALTALHILSLVWGIAVEVGPWPCPLTFVEQWLEARTGSTPYRGSFIVHYLDALVYPNIPDALLTWLGGGVCVLILGIYLRRFWRAKSRRN
jgi:hypothetical protein